MFLVLCLWCDDTSSEYAASYEPKRDVYDHYKKSLLLLFFLIYRYHLLQRKLKRSMPISRTGDSDHIESRREWDRAVPQLSRGDEKLTLQLKQVLDARHYIDYENSLEDENVKRTEKHEQPSILDPEIVFEKESSGSLQSSTKLFRAAYSDTLSKYVQRLLEILPAFVSSLWRQWQFLLLFQDLTCLDCWATRQLH